MPGRVLVDVSGIKTPEDSITIADLNLGENITILTDHSEVIVSVGYIAAEEVEAPAVESVPGEPAVVEKGKKTEEEEAA
jgi:hypothetical protein